MNSLDLHNPLTISTEGEDLRVLFPNGRELKLDNNDRGWAMLRDLCRAREIDALPRIGKRSEPVQHMIDTRKLIDAFEESAAAQEKREALELLKELGL